MFVNIYKLFLYESKLSWHITTVLLCFFLSLILLCICYGLFKTEKMSICFTGKIIDLFKYLIISVMIFRTFFLHYAFAFWCVLYILSGFLEKNRRRIRYINFVWKEHTEYRKAYKYIHCIGNNGNFFNCFKENILLSQNDYLSDLKIDRKNISWKKSFLSPNYFVMGLILPSLNLLVNGSQYSTYAFLPFELLEINILIFVVLWFIYPITYFLAVKIETGIMFQSKCWFNVGYFLFSFAIFVVLNGIVIVSN